MAEESKDVPTAPITKAGPAFTELKAIRFASFWQILFFEYSSAAIEQPTGKPAKSEKKTVQPAFPESLKILLKKRSVFLPRKSSAPLD